MKCNICDKQFISMEWYKEGMKDLILCDDCVLDILKARRYVKISELDSINRHIRDLKAKIKNEVDI